MSSSQHEVSFLHKLGKRVSAKLRLMQQKRLESFPVYLPWISGKKGLEIGGPSWLFKKGNVLPVYDEIGSLDNCDFSESTVWTKHSEDFFFSPNRTPGKTFFCDGSALVEIGEDAYDVVLSAHNLEHFANPVKALKEWQRVLRPGGALVLVLPNYRETFDHLRPLTSVYHMFEDFEKNTGEDDLTHLLEILEKHDLSRDLAAGSREAFQQRSTNNFFNRCLHHHVFDEGNSCELLSRVGFNILTIELADPCHIFLLASIAE